jgi:hypothetical protein
MTKKSVGWWANIVITVANLGNAIFQTTAKTEADKDKADKITGIVSGVAQTGGAIADQIKQGETLEP